MTDPSTKKPKTWNTTGLPAPLIQVLDRVKRRHLVLKLAEFPLILLGGLSLVWLLQAFADRLFDLPWSARLILLAANAMAVGWLFRRYLFIPWKRRLDRHDAALLVERSVPELRSSLISAVELSVPSAAPPSVRLLISRLVSDATSHATTIDLAAQVVTSARLRRLALRTFAVLGITAVIFLATRPTSDLLLRRILLSQERFPAATRVIPVTEDLTVTEGDEIRLTARAEGFMPIEGRLVILRDGQAPETLSAAPVADRPGAFSRILPNVREPFRYRFELNDGIGPEHQVTIQYPPAPRNVRFTLDYPDYTSLPDTELAATSLKLLEGSTLRIEGGSSKPLRAANVLVIGDELTVPLVVGGPEKTTFYAEVEVPGTGWRGLVVQLESDEGLTFETPPYSVELLRDKPPAVSLLEPEGEIVTVVMDSTIPLSIEVIDDYGISSAALHYRVLRPQGDGTLQDAESGSVPFEVPASILQWKQRPGWHLSRLLPAVPAGCEIRYWIEATDNNALHGPSASRSETKTARIVTPEQKRQELVELLAMKAAEIDQLYQQQSEIRGRTNTTIETLSPQP